MTSLRISFPCRLFYFAVVWALTTHAQASQRAPKGSSVRDKQAKARRLVRASLKLVEKRHPQLVMARLRLKGLQRVARASGMWPNPKLSYQREQLFPPVGQDTAGVQLALPLGGRTFRKKEAARMLVKAQRAYVRFLSFRIRYRFLRAYLKWQWLRQRIQLASRLLSTFRQLRVLLSARVKGGKAAGMSLIRFDMEVEQQSQKIQRDRERALVLSNRMRRWLGISQSQLAAHPIAAIGFLGNRQWAAKGHPYLDYLKAQVAWSRARVRLAKAKTWPDISLSIAYLRQQAATANQPDGHGFMVGLTLPLPLFQRNQSGLQRAQLQLRRARLFLRQRRRLLKRRAKSTKGLYRRGLVRFKRYQKRVLRRLPALFNAAQVAFRGGASFGSFLATYRSMLRYQQFGLQLGYLLAKRALRLEEIQGHVKVR